MRRGHYFVRSAILAVVVAAHAPVVAQSAADHAAHHGGGSTVAAPAMGSVPESCGSMSCGGNEHGSQGPLFPALMQLDPEDAATRHQLMREADRRAHDGLMAIEQGTDLAETAAPGQLPRIAEQVREGAAVFESGVAARTALADPLGPQAGAISWYRSRMGLPLVGIDGNHDQLLGFSPAHWLVMTVLTLASGLLLALQYLRARRVGELLAAFSPTAQPQPQKNPPKEDGAATGTKPPSPATAPSPLPGAPEPSNPVAAGPGSRPARRPWSGELRVAQIVRETPTVLTFRLVNPADDRLPFDFLPGQFVQVEVEAEPGQSAKRSYTIASSPTQRAYVEITVKKESQGKVSRHLHEAVQVGDRLRLAGPFGLFTFTGSDAESIVLIAGGVGVTPMMSVLRYLTDTAWPGEIFFIYGARSTEEFIFRDEIEMLERRHPRLHVLATMQRAPGTVWLGPEGQLTRELLQSAVPEIAARRVHMCGPPAMMQTVRGLLRELGVPDSQIFTEAFGPASLPPENAPGVESSAPAEPLPAPPTGKPEKAQPEIAPTTITFSIAQRSAALPADQTVLEAAEAAGVEIPFSCRVGVCGVCVTKLVEGEVAMAEESGLDPADKARGYVLACQAKCTRGPLVVEA